MVGYTEALTDPSYRGQIMVLTYPLVGNYGVPPAFESSRIQASALVVSEMAEKYSHAEAQKSLPQWLDEEGIPCIAGVDTRALTKRLRTRGCMLGKIVVGGEDIELSDPNKENLVAQVGNGTREVYPGKGKTVLLVDCGAKGSIIEELRSRGLTVIRVPWDHDFLAEDFDGLFISNGPGDPTACTTTIANIRKAMDLGKPIMGICLGNQLLALAAGANTYKLQVRPPRPRTSPASSRDLACRAPAAATSPRRTTASRWTRRPCRRAGTLVQERERRLERGHAPQHEAVPERAVPPRGRARPARHGYLFDHFADMIP